MTWNQFTANLTNWLRSIFAVEKQDDAKLDRILVLLETINERIETMSAQIDALTTEVAQVVNVLTTAVPLIEAAVAAEAQLAAIAAGNATDTEAVTKATSDLAAARTAFSAEVAKLSPAATTPAPAEAK